jgi:hypothetical protein
LTTKGKHIAKHNAERIWKEASILKQKRWAEERERDELGRFAGWK